MVGKRGFIYEANLLKMQTQISMYPEQVIKKKKKLPQQFTCNRNTQILPEFF